MPTPTTMAVTGTLLNPAGQPAAGIVRFQPRTTREVNNGVVITDVAQEYIVPSSGAISVTLVQLVAGYTVIEHVLGGNDYQYNIPGNLSSLDLSSYS